MVLPLRPRTLLAICLLAVLSVTSTLAAGTAQVAADDLIRGSHASDDVTVRARAVPPSESYVHRSQPSRYEPFVSAAVLLRNAQLKAAAAAKAFGVGRGSSVSNKQKSVSFRAATIKAAIMNSYTKRRRAQNLRKRTSGDAAAQHDKRAIERARRNMAHGRPDQHAARAHIVSPAKEAHGRDGKDRFRPREISKHHRHEHDSKKGDNAGKKGDKAGKPHKAHKMERMRKVPAKNGRR